jgi:hypothetical protein
VRGERGGERGHECGDVNGAVHVLALLELGGGLVAVVEGVGTGRLVGVEPD